MDSKHLFKTKEEEKHFYKLYPTIWRLRTKLIENDKEALSDIRNVYLAIHHIIKYRGNFLTDGDNFFNDFNDELIQRINETFISINCELEDNQESVCSIDKSKLEELKSILLNKELTKTSKQSKIKELFSEKNNYADMFAVIASGGKFKLSKINKEYKGEINFNDGFEDKALEIAQTLGVAFELVLCAKEMFDYSYLYELMNGEQYLSISMDKIYKEHEKDLKILKSIIKSIDEIKALDGTDSVYYKVFKDKNVSNNYAAFIQCESNCERPKIVEFNNFIKGILNDNKEIIDTAAYEYLLNKVVENKLLQTIAIKSTGAIPHQCHKNELIKIIDNAGNVYPFLREIKEKLLKLFMFRVPYYYGPLDDRSRFAWIQRKDQDKRTNITPWNIDEIVDDSETKKKFIKRLIGRCSYLFGEQVLPKSSLYFEKFMILDRLNVMTLNGSLLNQKDKEDIYNYITSRDKTTINQIKTHLAHNTGTKANDILIANIKEDLPFSAPSHAFFIKSKYFNISKDIDKIEDLILLATVYSDDKKSFKELLIKDYKYDEEVAKEILNIPTKKWSSMSKKLLCELAYIDNIGVASSILDVMWNENRNFQQVYFDDKYGFKDKVEEFNNQVSLGKNTNIQVKETLEEIPTMTARSINQALLIVDDIIKANKNIRPQKIFIETTRTNDDNLKGKETNSRFFELKSFLKDLDFISKENKEELNNELISIEQSKLKNKHIYLYFKQMGLDMYTGKKIDLNDVINGNRYDTDHIIPQSLIKDDSYDNLVLVDKTLNQRKTDEYPLPREIRTENNLKLWKYLREIGGISEKKYNNLIRNSEITLEEIEAFVARQINIVNYSNIQLRNILKLKYPNVEIVFSKSQYASKIRKDLQIAKNRDVNDAHHAVDAYLNIVAGNILSTTFSNVRRIYEAKKSGNKCTFNMDKVLESEVVKIKDKVKDNCFRHDALVTFKVDYQNGALYKKTICKASTKSDALYPIHSNSLMSDTSLYGGYTSLGQSYIVAIEYKIGKKEYKQLLRVPLLFIRQYGHDESLLWEKVIGNDNATDIKIIKKIHLNQKIKFENCIYLLYTSNETRNKYKMAYQNYIDNSFMIYFNKAYSLIKENKDKELFNNDSSDTYGITINRKGEVFEVSKKANIKFFEYLMEKLQNPIYDSCSYIVSCRNMNRDMFCSINLKCQIETLRSIILLLSRKSEMVKFSENMCEVKTFKLLPSTNILNKKIELIYESASGLYCHKELI